MNKTKNKSNFLYDLSFQPPLETIWRKRIGLITFLLICLFWVNLYQMLRHQDIRYNDTIKIPPDLQVLFGPPTEPRMCDFEKHTFLKNGLNIPWDRCMLEAREGYAYNIYMCKVDQLYIKQFLRLCNFRTVVETT